MKILIAGDFCPRNRVANFFDKGDFASVLNEVCCFTDKADYSIVNFECPVVTGNAKPIDKHGPHLCCSVNGVKAIKYAGFNCVTLANNHFLDFEKEGVANTITVLDTHNMDHVGGGMNLREASRTIYKSIAGKRLAIINCCEHEFSIATETTAGSNPLDPIQQYYAIRDARTKADFVIVIVHGGHELFQLPSPRMVETYRFFIDAGADAVVNHHQHCYSGYEVYNGRPIFYGLGNFCFDKPECQNGIWTEGYAVMITFTDSNPAFTIFPYRQCASKPQVEFLTQDVFTKKLEELNTIISDPVKLQSAVEQYYASCANSISAIFEPLFNRYYLIAKYKGWLPSLIGKKRKTIAKDFVICEAHRDKLMYWLNKEKK